MPPEYYLGAGVVLIVLVLLPFALMKKKPRPRAVSRPSGAAVTGPDELTRQLARVADGLEALLKHLQSVQLNPAIPMRADWAAPLAQKPIQPPVAPAPAAPLQTPLPPVRVPEPAAQAMVVEEPAAVPGSSGEAEPASIETVALEQSASEQPPKRRVKLSMFGR
jgi:hypothetical protein